nr:unnamed protein product [Callosobruchus chinensis]
MSLPNTNRSGTDVSSNSSWSVIEENENPPNSSIIQPETDKVDGSDEDARTSDIENSFITIPEDAAWTVDPSEHAPPPRKSKKRSRKPYAEPLSIVTILASILTITGITLLCMIFPQDIDTQSSDQLHRTYMEVVSNVDGNVSETINKTSEVLNVIQDADLLSKIHQTLECEYGEECSCKEEDNCSADEEATVSDSDHGEFEEIAGRKEKRVSLTKKMKSKVTSKKVKRHASVSDTKEETAKITKSPEKNKHLRAAAKNKAESSNLKIQPNSKVAKDQVNVSETNKEEVAEANNVPVIQTASLAPSQFSKIEAKLATPVDNQKEDSLESIQQPALLSSGSVIKRLDAQQKSAFDLSDRMTKRDDSQQRMQELKKKWKSAGNEHRDRIQLIKAEFKDEVLQAKQTEMDSFQRVYKIKIIRDKYAARLKMDKERYLAQLRRFQEDKYRLIDDVCRKLEQQTTQKNASGNIRQTLKNQPIYRSCFHQVAALPNDSAEDLAELQSRCGVAIDRDVAGISQSGSSQRLIASYASKLLAEPKEKNDSLSNKGNGSKNQQLGQASENALAGEAVGKTVSNESQTTSSFPRLNEKVNNSNVSNRQEFVEEEREKIPLGVRARINNKEIWWEYDNKYDYSGFRNKYMCDSSTKANTELEHRDQNNKVPSETKEEDWRDNDDTFGHSTVVCHKEDDTSGEQKEGDDSLLSPGDAEDQFKVVVRRKGRKRNIYRAASASENALVGEAVDKTASNETKRTSSFSILNEKVNNSKVSDCEGSAEEKERERIPSEGLRDSGSNNQDTWWECDNKYNDRGFKYIETNVSTSIPKTSKIPSEKKEKDWINICYKEDETSGEETESDNSSLSTEDAKGQLDIVVGKKGRKRDIYGAAFDENGQKIKETDMLKWGFERRMRSKQSSLFSKQDPKRAVKDKFSFKGPF